MKYNKGRKPCLENHKHISVAEMYIPAWSCSSSTAHIPTWPMTPQSSWRPESLTALIPQTPSASVNSGAQGMWLVRNETPTFYVPKHIKEELCFPLQRLARIGSNCPSNPELLSSRVLEKGLNEISVSGWLVICFSMSFSFNNWTRTTGAWWQTKCSPLWVFADKKKKI